MPNQKESFIILWLKWHYLEMPVFLISAWKNYLLFGMDYFSVPLLFSTLFSPWRHYAFKYPKLLHLEEFLKTLISNAFSRIMGVFIRVLVMAVGLAALLVIFLAGAMAIILWLGLPIFFVILIILVITNDIPF